MSNPIWKLIISKDAGNEPHLIVQGRKRHSDATIVNVWYKQNYTQEVIQAFTSSNP